jgi:shikimate dehydrogenase
VIGPRTRLVFLAGDPIGHTKGYAEYAAAFAQAGIDAVYLPLHVPAGGFADVLAGARQMRNLAGIVATIPHKQDAFAASRPDAAARLAGAANLLRPAGDGWESTNLDGTGFLAAARGAGIGFAGRRVQLLGAGGAGRAVAMAIAAQAPAALAIADPDAARADALAQAASRAFPALAVGVALGPAEVLVNCSPIGMGEDARLPLSESLVPERGAVLDIVNRADTPLLVAARARGCIVEHGRAMMLAQIDLLVGFLFGPP